MNTEERIEELEREFQATREELQQILLEIRAFLMEAENPLRLFEREKTSDQATWEMEVE